ncbi:MAG: phosphoribosylglycinamide formyltransferase [Prevotellaceae bacterium]|jgi:phosphoribosylglycinamide formyltransferase-1|nr:phosphoribosylglycinamide formyltransferase [Prevotellaceae bacterium]
MNNIAIFASGSGTNAENIIRYFNFHPQKGAKVVMLYANKPEVYALIRAKKLGVPTHVFDRDTFYSSNEILAELNRLEVALIVLAGFLWLMPHNIVEAFPNKIVNVHPALLPKFGGKGMYGMNVHKAVKEAGERETGITVHYVNKEYDSGSIIFQAKCSVEKSDSPEAIAEKIHLLEQENFPRTVEEVLHKI